MKGSTPASRFARAILTRDSDQLKSLCEADRRITLFGLDHAMRGLVLGVTPEVFEAQLEQDAALRGWVNWLLEQDRLLRRQLGWAQRDGDLTVLRAAYRAGDLALAVGAGTSIDAGMPDWKGLATHLIDDALQHGTPEHRKYLAELWRTNNARAVNIEGRMLLGEDANWEKALEAGLHPAAAQTRARLEHARRELAPDPGNQATHNTGNQSAALREAGEAVRELFGERLFHHLQQALFGRILYRTKVHPAIGRMVRPRDRQSDRLTPRVFAILTYNFDDLLETAIREFGQEFTVHLSRAGQPGALRLGRPFGHPERPSAVDIFHVHGFVPAPKGAFSMAGMDDADLVFSEAQYQAQYGKEANWTKQVQTALFGNAPVLFLGSSLADDESVAQLSKAHMRRPGWFRYVVLRLPEGMRKRKGSLTGEEIEQLATPYRNLGLHVLWIADWDEIPEILDSISAPPPEEAATIEATEHWIRFPRHLLNADADLSAALDLGIFFARHGESTAGRAALERVITFGEPELAAKAKRNLGLLLRDEGDLAGAGGTFLELMNSGDPEQAPRAAVDLGDLFRVTGDLEQAKVAFQWAIDSGHPVWAVEARKLLAAVLAQSA